MDDFVAIIAGRVAASRHVGRADKNVVAFRAMFDAEYRGVLAYVLRRAPVSVADEIVADTFIVAWRKWARRPPPEEVRPWLFGIARRVLLNEQRAGRRRNAMRARLGAERPPAEPVIVGDVALTQALAGLSATDREVLRLTAWEELSTREIATVLGCGEAAARVRIHRARNRLRGALDARSSKTRPPETQRTGGA